jgi:putative toxin-antitoxin system antitoxin component (TIGR02293 family)
MAHEADNIPPGIGHVQELARKYDVSAGSDYALTDRACAGIPVSAFFDLQQVSGLTNDELAGMLDLSYKSVQRYRKEGKKLNPLNSEQILKMIVLYQKAEEVIGSIASFNNWLRKPAAGLGNKNPIRYLQTPGGIDLIFDELVRIEYGALA